MTIQELHTLAVDLDTKVDALINGATSAKEILRLVKEVTSPQTPLSTLLQQLNAADQMVAAFIPDWTSALQSVEVAADALGTDALSQNVPPELAK